MQVDGPSPLDNLRRMLLEAPLMADLHPLTPLCVPPETWIVSDPRELLAALDSPEIMPNHPILLITRDKYMATRLPYLDYCDHPPIDQINQYLPMHLDYVRENLLTTHQVSAHIASDVMDHRYDMVVTLFIDGLSYGDTLDWGWSTIPCFVNGPSVTFQLDAHDRIIPSIGFPSIIGRPSITERLHGLGYHHATGYTYWRSEDNQVAEYLFEGIPDHKVRNFEELLYLLKGEHFRSMSYVQIVREGLDGLAHGKRELRSTEICSAAHALRHDIERLVELVRTKAEHAIVYVTADHGVLWKNEHDWIMLNQRGTKPRYARVQPEEAVLAHATRTEQNHIPYYLYHYPYLGSPIRQNDSGVHGGLSYQESFVPFIKIEV